MKKSVIILFLVMIVGLPILAASFLFHNPHYLSGKSAAQGKLLVPPLDARSLVGEPGSWQLLLLVSEHCRMECRQLIYYARQVHEALAKDKARVERKLLLRRESDSSDPELETLLKTQTPSLEMLLITEEQLRQVFPLATFNEAALVNSVFVVDPNGNLMLQHQHIVDTRTAKALLQDLKRLLRASRIG